MTIECTCKGLNSNCYKCFGRGYYNEDEINNKISYNNTQLYSKINDNNYETHKKIILTKCPYCNISIGRKKLNKHINDFHLTDNTVLKLKKCLKCGLILYEHETKNHMKIFHCKNINEKIVKDNIVGISYKNSNIVIIKVVNNKKTAFVKCNVCGCFLKKTRLEKHMRIIHDENSKNDKAIINKEIKPIVSEKTYVDEEIIFDENNEMTKFATNRRDGSKDWHIIRDNGKFGSHPIFEAMDDESSP